MVGTADSIEGRGEIRLHVRQSGVRSEDPAGRLAPAWVAVRAILADPAFSRRLRPELTFFPGNSRDLVCGRVCSLRNSIFGRTAYSCPTGFWESVQKHPLRGQFRRLDIEELNVKKLILALTAVAAFGGQAIAADMAARPVKALPPPPPVYSWTGCYLSGGGGYGMYNNDHNQIVTGAPNGGGVAFPVGTISQSNITTGGRGYLGTVGGGCDYQFGGGGLFGNLLIGAFADYTFSDIHGDYQTFAHYFADGSAVGNVGSLKQKDSWAVGGRIGWVVTPQLMTYFNGGYTESQFDGVGFRNNLAGGGFLNNVTGLALPSQTYRGWFLGGGTEYALGFAAIPGLFLRTEYRYSEFEGKTTV
jgi:outer membrane immunogenic protein